MRASFAALWVAGVTACQAAPPSLGPDGAVDAAIRDAASRDGAADDGSDRDGAASNPDGGFVPQDAGSGTTTMRTSVTDRGGVTWTFSQAVPVGQFVTGDYYVVGAATVTAISPAPSPGRNGSVVNIRPVQDHSGWDDRVTAGRWDASLRASVPIALTPGDSLVSAISVDTVGAGENWLREGNGEHPESPVQSYSVLSCLSAVPPADAFRPAYTGHGRVYRLGAIDRALLPHRAPAAAVDAAYTDMFAQHLSRPWVDNVFFGFDAATAYQPQYGREVARAVGIASLLLMLDLPAAQRASQEQILIGLVQYGIDLWGLVQAGYPGWQAFGGHGSGRKWPIVLAGILLGDADMASPSTRFPNVRFGEDMHTAFTRDLPYGPAAWNGATVVYTGHQGVWHGMPVNTDPSWGPYEHLPPSRWPVYMAGERSLGEIYRRCCTSLAWVGEALAARLMNAQATWNHDAFFAYVDRWMTVGSDPMDVQTIRAATGEDFSAGWEIQGQTWDAFVQGLWRMYR